MSPNEDAPKRLAERGSHLVSLLKHEKGEHQRKILLWGGLRILAYAGLGAVTLAVLGALAPVLPSGVGVGLGILAWTGLLFLVWRFWIRPLRAVPNLGVFSRLVEERHDFKDMLRAALEFSQRGTTQGESLDLASATVDRAYDEANALQLTRLFQFPKRRRDALLVAASAGALAVLATLVPTAPRVALGGLAFGWPSPADIVYGDLEVIRGDRTIASGADVEVRVREHGPVAPEIVLRFNDTGDLWKSRPLEPDASGESRFYREYAFRFETVRNDLVYRFESAGRSTDEHRVRVVQHPIVNQLVLRLVPPKYTGRDAVTLEEGRGDAVALLGTRVEIDAASSSPLASAILVPEGEASGKVTLAKPLSLETNGALFQGGFVLRGDLRYHFELLDSLGYTNTDPVTYQLGTVEDRPPYVEIRFPGQDADIPKSMQVPLEVYASDDFGLSSMTLVFRRARESEDLEEAWTRQSIAIRGKGATDAEGRSLGRGPTAEVLRQFDWSLDDAGLYPGDHVSYYVEVEDNDDFSGHKTARTPFYKLRLPTLADLYAKIQEEDKNRVSQIDDVLEKGKQLHEKYSKLSRELKKHTEMNWKKEKEVEGALEKQKQLSEQVEKIAEDLQKELERMQEQNIVGEEIAQKMEEIRKLLQEVENETLREYRERLQEAMKKISPEEIQKAMEKMSLSQEEFLKRLERTKSLLEQLRREQELDSLVERVSELLQSQEQLGESTKELQEETQETPSKNSENPEAERLAQDQEDLSERTEDFQEDLERLAEEMKGVESLDEANREAQEQNPSGEMQRASDQLQEGQKSSAQQHQQKAEQSLRALYQDLMAAQQSMSTNAQAQAAEALQKAARQALDVSFRQEGLSRRAPTATDYDRQGELAEEQQSLLVATGRVVGELDSLAKKSLAAPPQVPPILGEAIHRMREGVQAYEKGNVLGARIQGEEAYGLLNRAVIELSRSSQSACSSGSGQGASQRLEQLMGRQQSLNDMTRKLQQSIPNPQSLSPEERAQMSRLLGEQRAVESELQDIERQAREERELLGRMDKTADEMKEVIQDMESEALSEETLRVQERIVSRMLDSRRSLHKRDYNQRRESRTAREIFSKGGKPLPEDERTQKLRRDIERALRSGTPEEYQELVRQYFRAISELEDATRVEPTP